MDNLKPYYPKDWQDDETMDVLFSQFRENRDINPHSWDRKMNFWKEMIRGECIFDRSPIISAELLPRRFVRKNKVPICLEKVLQEMYRSGKIDRISNLEKKYTQGWISWGFDWMVLKPLSWSWGLAFGSSPIKKGEFVITDLLQNCGDAVLERHYSSVENEMTDNVVEFSTLLSRTKDLVADERTLRLVLLYLCSKKKVSFIADNKETIVRFVPRNQQHRSPSKDTSEIDLGIMRMKKTGQKLEDKLDEIYQEMDQCKEEARAYLKKGQRNAAKSSLRRKKVLEKKLEETLVAQDNLRAMMERLKDTESNKMILDAYSAGTTAYKGMLSAYDLNPQNVDKVMDDFNETLELDADISAAMAHDVTSNTLDISAEELEDELKDILAVEEERKKEERMKEERKKVSPQPQQSHDKNVEDILAALDKLPIVDDDFLPDVPTFDPNFGSPSPSRVTEESLQETSPFGSSRTFQATRSPHSPGGGVNYPSHSAIGFTPDQQRSPQQTKSLQSSTEQNKFGRFRDPRLAKDLSPGGYYK